MYIYIYTYALIILIMCIFVCIYMYISTHSGNRDGPCRNPTGFCGKWPEKEGRFYIAMYTITRVC